MNIFKGNLYHLVHPRVCFHRDKNTQTREDSCDENKNSVKK